MTTGTTQQVTHRAYMEYCEKDKRCPLPAITVGAKAFLAPCEAAL